MMAKKMGWLGALMIVAHAQSAPARSTAGLDNVLRAAVEQRRVPGVVAMVATTDAVAYQGAFGIDKDAIFAIAHFGPDEAAQIGRASCRERVYGPV